MMNRLPVLSPVILAASACANGMAQQQLQHDGLFHSEISPLCRRNALQVLNDNFGSPVGEHYCRSLSFEHQELLAIELTKCHFDGDEESGFLGPCEASMCRKKLTDRGFLSYTMFKVHAEQYCIKINHDLMLLTQQELGAQLQRTAHDVTVQFSHLREHQDEMKEEYGSLFSSFRVEQTELHSKLLEEALHRQDELHEKAVARQQVQEQQLQEWMTRLMQGQTEEIQRQRRELRELTESVGATSAQLKPFLGMDKMFGWISSGMQITHLIVYLYVTVNLLWLATIPSRVRGCRRKLWILALFEFLVKCLALGVQDDSEQDALLVLINWSFRTVYSFIYVSTFLTSFLATSSLLTDNDQREELLQAVYMMNKALKRVERKSHQLEVKSAKREDRLVQILEEIQNRQSRYVSEETSLPTQNPAFRPRVRELTHLVTPSPTQLHCHISHNRGSQNAPVAPHSPIRYFGADVGDDVSVETNDSDSDCGSGNKRLRPEEDTDDEDELPPKKRRLIRGKT